MNKGIIKIGLFFVVFLAIIIVSTFYTIPTFAASFISQVTPSTLNASTTTQILNFTINNTDTSKNITEVNITIPSGFNFIDSSNTTTAVATNFSNTTNIVRWTNTTEEGFVENGTVHYFIINVSVPSVKSDSKYNFTVTILDTNDTSNSTNVTITVNDISIPFSPNGSSTWPSNYSQTTLSEFNITWTDNVEIDKVFISFINFTNSSHVIINNDSMTNDTYSSDIYNYSIFLPAGTWNWTSYANDTSNNLNSYTSWVTITKAPTNITLWLNETEGSKSYNLNDLAKFTAQVDISELTVYLNSSYPGWEERSNATTVYNETVLSSPGIFNITAYTLGNENYSASSKTFYFDTTGPQYNYVNETPTNDSYYSPNQNYSFSITVTDADFDTVIFKLYNATNVSGGLVNYTTTTTNHTSINATTEMYYVNLTDLPAGTYNYSWYVSDTTDKNHTTDNLTYIIKKSINSTSITASSTSVTSGTQTTVTCINYNKNAGRSEVSETLKLEQDTVNSTHTIALPVGPWTYYCTASATGNYSNSQSSITIIVSQATAFTPSSFGSTGGTPIASAYVIVRTGKVNISITSITTVLRMISTIAKYEDVAIRGMNISVINNVENVKIMISKIPLLPSTVPFDISGVVYHYINIERINITDSDISVVNIGFAVNKTWLTDNNLDASNITLYRWANNKWNDLNATKISEGTEEVFYNANSRGLSVFIIGTTGGAPVEPITGATVICTESWSCTGWSACTNNIQTRTCADANNCGTTANKPSESQSCEAEKAAAAKTAFSILTNAIIIVGATVICILIFLERTKITSYLGVLVKKVGSIKKPKKTEEKEKVKVKTS